MLNKITKIYKIKEWINLLDVIFFIFFLALGFLAAEYWPEGHVLKRYMTGLLPLLFGVAGLIFSRGGHGVAP
jgi:hypothetical protein